MEKDLEGFIDFFKKVPDHRLERKKLHRVEEILFLTFCATIAGCDGWDDIELYGQTKMNVLREYFVEGATVTIDVMGYQTKVVEKIVEKKANYVLGLWRWPKPYPKRKCPS